MKALPARRALVELFLATIFWGFGYIATVWALEMASALEITFLRFFLGGLFGLFFVRSFALRSEAFFKLLRLSFWPGFFMATLLLSQTWGLEYTTAVNSTFITSLYVVITPFLEWAVLKKRSPVIFFAYACVSLVGVGLILRGSAQSELLLGGKALVGDLLTLITACFSAAHLVSIGRIWREIERPFLFNAAQSLWAALLLFPFLIAQIFFAGPHSVGLFAGVSKVSIEAVIGLLSLIFGSTMLAFFLQLRAQSVLSPSLTSLVCLLESPLALAFALIFLHQPLSSWALLGAVLIFISAVGASLTESWLKRSPG